MSEYEPELGQAVYGQRFKKFECPTFLDAALMRIRSELCRVLWNVRQKDTDPFVNSGDAFRCSAFGVWAYSWSDEDQPYNFKHVKSGVEVSWYKYFGRGMSVNADISPDLAARMLDHCLSTLIALDRRIDEGSMKRLERPFLIGSIEDVPYF